ncbi:MAG TPA: response regulator [Terriglobales bacterium]|nr:response regulator [Terriglobales bacterium]
MEYAPLQSNDGHPVRCLVVDDSIFARKNLAKMLNSFGVEVVGEAGDGAAALAEYRRCTPDVVLMDITMPKVEGLEALQRIIDFDPRARVVMVSSVGYQENIVTALQKGARHFVQKPVNPSILYEVLKYVINDTAAQTAAVSVRS